MLESRGEIGEAGVLSLSGGAERSYPVGVGLEGSGTSEKGLYVSFALALKRGEVDIAYQIRCALGEEIRRTVVS